MGRIRLTASKTFRLGSALVAAATLGVFTATAGFSGSRTPQAASSAGPTIGVAEDAMQYAEGGGKSLFDLFGGAQLGVARLTLTFDGNPATITNAAGLDAAAVAAKKDGIALMLSLYPASALAPDPQTFCTWVGNVAARYYPKGISRYIVGNEVNATRFWSPQHTASDQTAGPDTYELTLATCYDVLKQVSSNITVVGMGLAPRSVDSNSTPPIDFIKQVGAAYKATGRSKPIMDEIAVHPYPNPNASPPPAPLSAGYVNTGFYGIPQIQRVKDAVATAFAGTNQPTTANGLGIVIDEIGYQSDESSNMSAGYSGTENSPSVSEGTQATYYSQVVALYACDSSITDVLFFHLVDEPNLNTSATSGGWQSGLVRPDISQKPAYASVASAVKSGCSGSSTTSIPTPTVTSKSTVTSPIATVPSPAFIQNSTAALAGLNNALDALNVQAESMPALSTDGEASTVLSTQESNAALNRVARNLAATLVSWGGTSFDLGSSTYGSPVNLPTQVWALPENVLKDSMAYALTYALPACAEIDANGEVAQAPGYTVASNRFGSMSSFFDVTGHCWPVGGGYAFCNVHLENLGNHSRSIMVQISVGNLNSYRYLENVRQHGITKKKLGAYLVSYGKTKLNRGQRLHGVMHRNFKRPIPGVYRTFIIVRSRSNPKQAVVLSLRPQIVKAKRSDLQVVKK